MISLQPEAVELETAANATLTATPPRLPAPDVQPAQWQTWDVESWYVHDGVVVADEPLGTVVEAEIGVGDVEVTGAWYRPYDVTLEAQARFLPLAGLYEGNTWSAFSGSERFTFDAQGSDPVLDLSYEYVRGADLVVGQALRLDDGDRLVAASAPWVAESLTVLVVAVLYAPQTDFYGVLESAEGADPFVSLRYTDDGDVELWHRGARVYQRTLNTGRARAGQPVLLGFSAQRTTRRLSAVVMDDSLTVRDVRTVDDLAYPSQLVLGASAGTEGATASMDVLEVAAWTTDLPRGELLAQISLLDAIYGVSA